MVGFKYRIKPEKKSVHLDQHHCFGTEARLREYIFQHFMQLNE